jgi:DNA-binding HxlR family transcriptional regulator
VTRYSHAGGTEAARLAHGSEGPEVASLTPPSTRALLQAAASGEPVACPVETAMRVLSGKWKPLIVYHLLQETRRFSQLKRLLPGVTQQMLTVQLRELERDGLVHREVYREVPPRVEYSLTPIGRQLQPVFERMVAWGVDYVEQQAARPDA